MNIAERNRLILAKLRALPDRAKKIILWTVVVILFVTMGYFWVNSTIKNIKKISESAKSVKLPPINLQFASSSSNNERANWKTYINKKYGFKINYPETWSVREYGSGAALSPKVESTGNGAINIGFYERGQAYCKISFDDYVKIAGPSEIQNYENLNTINGFINDNGLNLYTATWNYTDFQGNKKISLPISYFETKPELCGDIEVFLNDSKYEDIYGGIISTFNFTK